MEELEGLLARIAPGATGKDKTLKLELLDEVFATTSMTAIGEMKLDELRAGYRKLMDLAVEKGLAHYIEIDGQKRFRPGEDPATKALADAITPVKDDQAEAPSSKGRKAAAEATA